MSDLDVIGVDGRSMEPPPAPVLSTATAAKYAKPAVFQGVFMRFPRAMKEIARVSMFGTQKHNVPLTDMSYMDIPDAYNVYRDGEARHIVNEAIEGPVNLDPTDGGMLHPAQRAWNVLAQLEIYLRDRERAEQQPQTGQGAKQT